MIRLRTAWRLACDLLKLLSDSIMYAHSGNIFCRRARRIFQALLWDSPSFRRFFRNAKASIG